MLSFPTLDNLTDPHGLHIPSSKLQTSAINCLLASQNQHVTTPKFIILAKLSSPRYSPSQLTSLTFTHLYTLEIWRHLWLFPHSELIMKACPLLLLNFSGIYSHFYFHQWCAGKWLTTCSGGKPCSLQQLLISVEQIFLLWTISSYPRFHSLSPKFLET